MDIKSAKAKRATISIIMIVSILLLITVPFAFGKAEKNTPNLSEAPDFILSDLTGRRVRLGDFKDKVVLIAFSTTWCPNCLKATQYLKELHRRYHAKGLEILNVDIQESHQKVQSYARKYKIPYRVLLDRRAEVAREYQVFGVPTLILIDKDGTVICRQCRSLDTILEKLLS